MLDRWVDRSVDLEALAESFKQFFEGKSFHYALEKESAVRYRIIAVPKRTSDTSIMGSVNVLVQGEANDFEVEFIGESSSRFAKLGGLATLLGGGIFWLKALKSSEELEKLESEFWLFADKKIDNLSEAARRK